MMKLYNAIFDRDGICYGITNKEIKDYYKEFSTEYKSINEFLDSFIQVQLLKIDVDYLVEVNTDGCLINDLIDDKDVAYNFIAHRKNYKWEDGKLLYKNRDITDDLYYR